MQRSRRITSGLLIGVACAAMAGCTSTASLDASDDVVAQPSAAISASANAPGSAAATLMSILVAACSTLTDQQTAELQSALQDLIALGGADQGRADPQLVARNVQLFLDNFGQTCGTPFSSDELRDLTRELTSAVGS